jgi:tetratricopeptide (TPR) repeat protein
VHRRPNRCRRGFILFFGTREVVSSDGVPLADARCPRCQTIGSLAGTRVRSWFTLFFIPVFPIGRGRRFTKCGHCAASFAVPPEQFETVAARADARQLQRAIGMYNSLRSSPANSVTLNDLMQLYASIGEYRQAISAANDFPAALNNSEQCMTTLGRVYLTDGNAAAGGRWLDAALARNPDLGEAWFQKAIALLKATPPDRAGAAVAAKAAKKAGHPGAEEMLADLQAGGDPVLN